MTTTETKLELTQADEYRREVSGELSIAMKDLHSAQAEWEQFRDETKEAKSSVDVAQRRVNRLADELRDIEVGQYQPRLMKPAVTNGQAKEPSPEVPAPDPVAPESAPQEPTPIEALVDHGLTKKQVEMLQQSELEISTVEDLEKCMREDEWWHRKIKGIGKTKIDRVTDALLAFRQAHPVQENDPADTEEGRFSDRNAPGGKPCGNVNRTRFNAAWGSVTIATGLMPDQTWRSSWLLQREGQASIGSETPREDSAPSATQAEAAIDAAAEMTDVLAGESKHEFFSWVGETWPAAENVANAATAFRRPRRLKSRRKRPGQPPNHLGREQRGAPVGRRILSEECQPQMTFSEAAAVFEYRTGIPMTEAFAQTCEYRALRKLREAWHEREQREDAT